MGGRFDGVSPAKGGGPEIYRRTMSLVVRLKANIPTTLFQIVFFSELPKNFLDKFGKNVFYVNYL